MNIGSISGGGMPSLAQMQQMHQRLFGEADTDASGALSLDEFKSLGKNAPMQGIGGQNMPSADEMFAKLDADGDGALTAAEMEPPQPPQGAFSDDMMSALLGMQEEDSAATFSAESSAVSLLQSLLAQLKQESETSMLSISA